MRHLRSLLYALVLAPTLWTLSAVAFTQDLTGRARDEQTLEALTGFLLLLLAGAAFAILLLPRFSPVGPTTAGAVFLALSIWVLFDAGSFRSLWPATVTRPGFDLTLPAQGLAALLAVPLLCTALSARRWRESRFEPNDAHTGTFVWPFARPTRPGTLVVPGVTGVPTADATQLLPNVRPGSAAPQPSTAADAGDRTQVIPPPSTTATTAPDERTQTIDAGRTQTIDPGRTQTIDAGRTQTIDPGRTQNIDADRTQTIDPGRTQTIGTVAGDTRVSAPLDARPPVVEAPDGAPAGLLGPEAQVDKTVGATPAGGPAEPSARQRTADDDTARRP